jgi:hypothetical protein
MRKFIYSFCISLISAICIPTLAQTPDQIKMIRSQSNLSALLELQNEFYRLQYANKMTIQHFAKRHNIPLTYEYKGSLAELQEILPDGTPLYYATNNVEAAKSTRTNYLHTGGSLGLELMGQNMTAYVWDGGLARSTHQEYNGRYTIGDNSTALNYHAAHVTGTIISSGVFSSAKGMAPNANAIGYDWNNDLSEATASANTGMILSNHSYGYASLDANGNYALPNYYPGAYINLSRSWDQLMFNAPYYLMVVAAGNDGNYPITNSPLDGNMGYDKLTGHCTSKNNLVVANAQHAVLDANGKLISLNINSSSSQGPTDDLRIKPDITGVGTGIFSTMETSNTTYGTLTGTSMASPNVMGSLLLLQEHYQNLNGGNFMRAATLKGLALHTADDAGPTGPDAVYGWGLLNAKKAAETISLKNVNSYMFELNLDNNSPQTIHVTSDGINELRASISWTDRPGTANFQLNNPTPKLMSDLDIRVIKNSTTYYPWRLTGVTSSGKGDNIVDPFERVDVPNASGNYTIQISHKGSLQFGGQPFSLIVTGITAVNCNASIISVNTGVACGTTSAPIEVQGNSNTTVMRLYSTILGTTPVQTIEGNSGTFFTPEILGDATFYITAGTANCESARMPVHIMYAAAPSELSISRENTPQQPVNCKYDVVKLTADGGIEESILFYEDFSSGIYVNWASSGANNNLGLFTVNHNYSDGGPPEIALGYSSGNTTGSWQHFPYDRNSNQLIPIDLGEYAQAKINFRHMFDADTNQSSNRNIFVEVSTDGTNFSPVWSRTNVQEDIPAEEVEIDISQYDHQPQLFIRFRYEGAAMSLKNWFMDDVIVKGTKQNPVIWSPMEGLYLDDAKTQPYNGEHALEVYASPNSTQTFTASVASTQNDCVITQSETIEINSLEFIASSGNWNNINNWLPPNLPTLQSCVKVPNGKILTVDFAEAVAKNVEIENGGKLVISAGNTLKIENEIINYGTKNDFVIEDESYFIQLNDLAQNIGEAKTFKKFIFTDNANPANDRKQYNYVISPLIGQTIKTIYPGNPSVIEYQEHSNYFTNSNGQYVEGKAFAIKEPSKAAVPTPMVMAEFSGMPFNGEMAYTLKYTYNPNSTEQGYNLIGNPYASSLDLKSVYEKNKEHIEPNFFFWDNRGNELHVQQGSNYNGDHYAYFNAVAGGGTGVAAAGVTESLRIPTKNATATTGFIVQAKPEANQTVLMMDNSMRNNNAAPSFTGKGYNSAEEVDRYWLNLTTPENLSSMIAVVYFEEGTNEFSLDDSKSFGSSDEIYSIVDAHQLKIQGRTEFENTDTVKIGYRAFRPGTYTFSIFQHEGVFSQGQEIFIYDKVSNRKIDLQENNYSFRTEAGEFNDRFEVVYKVKNIKLSPKEDLLTVFKQNQSIQIESSLQNMIGVEIFDIYHQLIYKNDVMSKKSISIPAQNMRKQVYFINIQTEDGTWTMKKYLHR